MAPAGDRSPGPHLDCTPSRGGPNRRYLRFGNRSDPLLQNSSCRCHTLSKADGPEPVKLSTFPP